MRYRLRTLMIASAVGPVLLALAWYGGIWFWYGPLPDLMQQWSQTLGLLAFACAVALAIFSIVSPWARYDIEDRASPWSALMVGGVSFFALWAAFWPSFLLLGWMFIWGDNQSPMDESRTLFGSGFVAALVAASITVRGIIGLATNRYVLVVVFLSGLILLLLAPMYVRQWLR